MADAAELTPADTPRAATGQDGDATADRARDPQQSRTDARTASMSALASEHAAAAAGPDDAAPDGQPSAAAALSSEARLADPAAAAVRNADAATPAAAAAAAAPAGDGRVAMFADRAAPATGPPPSAEGDPEPAPDEPAGNTDG
jgi:hypothetical protein